MWRNRPIGKLKRRWPKTLDHYNEKGVLTEYINEYPRLVAETYCDNMVELLRRLKFKALDLTGVYEAAIDFGNEDAFRSICENNFYAINGKNISLIRKEFEGDKDDLQNPCDWLSIISSGCSFLVEYIDDNIDSYVENVFLKLGDDAGTERSSVDLLGREELSYESKKKIIKRKCFRVKEIGSIDKGLWGEVCAHGRLDVSWSNIKLLINEFEGWKGALFSVFENIKRDDGIFVRTAMEELDDAELVERIAAYVIYEYSCDDDMIRALIGQFEGVDINKLDDFHEDLNAELRVNCLIEFEILQLNEAVFDSLQGRVPGCVLPLIKSRLDDYIAEESLYPLGADGFRSALDSMSTKQVENLVNSPSTDFSGLNERGCIEILSKRLTDEISVEIKNAESLRFLIVETEDSALSLDLLLSFNGIFSRNELVEIVRSMKEPYSSLISPKGDRSHSWLTISQEHRRLAEILRDRGIMSSIEEKEGESIRLRNKRDI